MAVTVDEGFPAAKFMTGATRREYTEGGRIPGTKQVRNTIGADGVRLAGFTRLADNVQTGIILTSPDGTFHELVVSNGNVITATTVTL